MIFHAKSQPAPDCLAQEKVKSKGQYNCPEVLDRLKADFKNKCYLCEEQKPHSINTEHFKPHKGNIDLKFDWDNLFYCCAHCNNIKGDMDEDILNCIILEDDVDRKIKYWMNPFPKEKVAITALEDNSRVHKTVDLLNKIYNGTTPLKTIESANVRANLLKEILAFQNLLVEYYDDNCSEAEKTKIRQLIIRSLRPSSNYTAFKLWIIRDNEVFAEEFADFIFSAYELSSLHRLEKCLFQLFTYT